MEKIFHEGKLIALKVSSMADGLVPMTQPEEALQVLTLKHPKGRLIVPHVHVPCQRETTILQEILIVIRGKLRVSFFDEKGNTFAQIEIMRGEACLTLTGPHGVEFLEDSEVIEVKNGPFIEDKRPLSV